MKCGASIQSLANRLEDYVEGRKNILISGGTGTGKTTTLNVLGKLISDDDRILLIEDTSEIQLAKSQISSVLKLVRHRMVPAVAIRDFSKASLRHRPDRIILGEIRGGEAFDLLQLLNTGHSGTLSTVHANSAQASDLRASRAACLQSGVELPYRAIKTNIGDSLNVVIQIERRPGRRFVSEVLEINRYNPEADLFDCRAIFQKEEAQP